MIEKIILQNEFVDFDLELSDFNLFVELDAPVYEKACTMGGFYNGQIPANGGVVWHDFRNKGIKPDNWYYDDMRRIIELFEENKEKYVVFLKYIQKYAPFIKGFEFEYVWSDEKKQRVKPVSVIMDFGEGKPQYLEYYDLSEELIRWLAVCLALVGPEYNETIYCFDQIERGLSDKQIKLLPELIWRQENKQIAVITKSPSLVNAFVGLIQRENDVRPNIFVGLNSTRIAGDVNSGGRNASKIFSYKPAITQSDYCEDGVKFECATKDAVNRYAYAKLIEFLLSDGAEILKERRISG